MNELGISLADYGLSNAGFGGSATESQVAELQKAMFAGQITGRTTDGLTTASGAPLKVESLENTLKLLTFNESDIVLWKNIPKLPAYNTVEEYNQLVDYGNFRRGSSFTNEGELPEENDSTFVRRSQLVKYLGTTRSVSHQMQLVNTTVGNIIQQQTQHATMEILREADYSLTTGNADIIPQQWNGLYQQHQAAYTSLDAYYDSDVVVDLRGKALAEADIEDASLTIIENFGQANWFMAPPRVLNDFVKRFYTFKQIFPNTEALTNGTMGQQVNKFVSQFGTVELGYDKFMAKDGFRLNGSAATNLKAPSAPTLGGAPQAAVADATTKFVGFEGDYFFSVAAVNRYGESQLVSLGALLTVGVGESVDLQFVDGGGAIPATGYRIYCSEKDPATAVGTTPMYPLFYVSVAELAAGYDGAAATIVRNKNRIIPNTEECFLSEPTTNVMSFKQLAPLMKMDLATLGPATRFCVLMYGTPQLYAPGKFVKFINVGTDLT